MSKQHNHIDMYVEAISQQVAKENVDIVENQIRTNAGTVKVTKTHVYWNNQHSRSDLPKKVGYNYKNKLSHDEVRHIIKGGSVRGFKLDKDTDPAKRAPKNVHVIGSENTYTYIPHDWEKHIPKK